MSTSLPKSRAAAAISACIMFLMTALAQQPPLQPMDITRTAGEMFVFIPCPFEFSSSPPIWRINGTDYTASTLPPIYSLTPGGLFITVVHICLDQVPYQCVDLSGNSLQEEVSDVGVLTVRPQTNETCTDNVYRDFQLLGNGGIEELSGFEVDHRNMEYGSINTTFAWKIILPPGSECSMSQIISYPQCQLSNPDIDATIPETRYTIASTRLYISGQLADFHLSSLSEQESVQCVGLDEIVRINVNETETIEVLSGYNDCSCVQLESLKDLHFAVSNPYRNKLDIKCGIYASGETCYRPKLCNDILNNKNITDFFRICGNGPFTLCSGNISKSVDGLRLDFYRLTRMLPSCSSFIRTYTRSFIFKVANASSNTEVNISSRQICFSSITNCSLINSTQYSVVITDLYGNKIFEKGNVPESSCLTVDQLGLLPQCGPFKVLTIPQNDRIVYNSSVQLVSSGTHDDPEICSCLEASVELQLDAVYNSQDSLVELKVQCSTFFTMPINVTVSDINGFVNQTTYACSNEIFNLVTNSGCNQEIQLCRNFVFDNESVVMDCPVNCNYSVLVLCPTLPPTVPTTPSTARPGPSPSPLPPSVIAEIVTGIVLPVVLIVILAATLIYVFMIRRKNIKRDASVRFKQNTDLADEPTATITGGNDDPTGEVTDEDNRTHHSSNDP